MSECRMTWEHGETGAIRGSQWVVIEEASHLPHVEQPEEFRDVVNGFLSGLGH